ncbi:MAG: tetratricopeptide repeat protein [Candidatus Omnitrophica bacterium]|nr:tetratricopeptide repeat protein [Candidatus Omnitrophota bacterium]
MKSRFAKKEKVPGQWKLNLGVFLGVVFIVGLGTALYHNTIQQPFQFDDKAFILENPALRTINNPRGILKAVISQPSRPVGLYTFAFNYFFHKFDTQGYHITNIAIHLLNTFWVWTLGYLIFSIAVRRKIIPGLSMKEILLISFFGALLFLSHPVQTQAVTYISQRFASLATLFYLCSIAFFLNTYDLESKFVRVVYVLYAMLAAVLGMFTKEIVITLPVMIAFLAVLLRGVEKKAYSKKEILIFSCVLLFFLAIIPLIFSFKISAILFAERPSGSHDGDIITFWPYLLTQFRVTTTFMRLMVLPINQNLDYDYPLLRSLFDINALWGVFVYFGGLALAIWLFLKKKFYAFGLFWFYIVLLANFVPRRHLIFEHKCYLASVGLCLAFVYFLYTRIQNKKIVFGILCTVICVMSVATVKRNEVWNDEISLWTDVIKKSPNKSRGYLALGTALMHKKAYDAALLNYETALEICPGSFKAYNNIGMIHFSRKNYPLALSHYRQSININPSFDKAYLNRGNVYVRMDEYNFALENFDKAIELNPDSANAYSNRGNVYKDIRRYELALKDLNKAIELNPLLSQAYNNRGIVWAQKGTFNDALSDFNQAIDLNPRSADAHYNLGLLHESRGELLVALEFVEKALRLEPDYFEAHNHQGIIYRHLNKHDQALASFSAAIQAEPNNYIGYNNRGSLYLKLKKYKQARSDFDQAIRNNDRAVESFANRANVNRILKNYESALKDINQAIRLNPTVAIFYYYRSLTYGGMNLSQEAAEDCQKAQDLGFDMQNSRKKVTCER